MDNKLRKVISWIGIALMLLIGVVAVVFSIIDAHTHQSTGYTDRNGDRVNITNIFNNHQDKIAIALSDDDGLMVLIVPDPEKVRVIGSTTSFNKSNDKRY